MADLAATIKTELQTALDSDQLELPTPPEVALRIRDEAESTSVTGASLATIIRADPGLAASLLRVANSALFRGVRVIDELPAAINRMGLEYAANLATGLAMQHMFQATSELVDRKLRQTWRYSTLVADLSAYIAKHHSRLRVDQAMLAGLTHTIGTLPILAWAEENDDLLRDSMTMDRVVDSLHGSLGTMILQHWDFPDPIAMVPSQYLDHTRHTETPDYISIVSVASNQANRVASAGGGASVSAGIENSNISAYAHLNIDPNDAEFIESMDEVAAEATATFN